MDRLTLAHFSDIHVTHHPLSGALAPKRALAVLSHSLLGRGRDFEGSDARIAALLDDVDAELARAPGASHALCTGDLTAWSTEGEFARCAELFGPRLEAPERYTVLPGNHDRYVAEAEGRFERHFAVLCGGARFPLVKRLAPGVTLVAIDVSHAVSLLDSSGWAGPQQLAALEGILTDASLRDDFVVLALHYGLLTKAGRRDRPWHRLREDVALMALLARPDVTCDLVLHGHLHTAYTLLAGGRRTFNAGSGTDLHTRCGYNLYEVEPGQYTLRCRRRTWLQGAYREDETSPLAGTYRTR